MHQSRTRRASRRRGAPLPPKRRKAPPSSPRVSSTTGGFEALIPTEGSKDPFFSGWLQEPAAAAEFLEHGGIEPLETDPRVGMVVSGALHVLIVLFLLFEPSLGLLGKRPEPTDVTAQERNPLLLFMEEPRPAEPPPVAEAPLVPVPVVPDTATPAPAEPPAVADNRMLIPKALLAPPEEKVQDFMNDLPFSEGNTEEFYTDKEVKDPGEEGEPEPTEPAEAPKLARESGEDEAFSEKAEGTETGNDGTKVAERRPSPDEIGALLFGDPARREAARPRAELPPPTASPEPQATGQGGENGAFTDIRRFLSGTRFDNPEGGLVANTDNTLYYNDKGANFVPWIRRMIAEVRRNWIVPYSITFNHGHVAVGISVSRSGTVTEMKVLYPSGTSGFDNAAVGAIRAAQLLPLPADYPDDQFDIILVFWYNERPYDIFG